MVALIDDPKGPIPREVYVLGRAYGGGVEPLAFNDRDGEWFLAAFVTHSQAQKGIRRAKSKAEREAMAEAGQVLAKVQLPFEGAMRTAVACGVDYLALNPFQGRVCRTFRVRDDAERRPPYVA